MAIVINPQGVVGEVPDNQIQDALAQGYASAAPEQAQAFLDDRQRRETYGTTGQAILGGVEAGARALTFGLSDVLEQGLLGAKPEGIRAREEENPIAAGIGTGVGILGPLLIPGEARRRSRWAVRRWRVASRGACGTVGARGRGGSDGPGADPPRIWRGADGRQALPEASTALGKAAARAAVEGARASRRARRTASATWCTAALGDPDLTWQKAATEIGLSGLLGGGIGGALGAPGGTISHLLEGGAAEGGSKIGAKLADWLGEFQGQRGIKAAGGIQSDITRVEKQIGRARLNELGQEMFDHGLVGPLSTPASTLERAQALQEKAGGEIGAMLREADAKTAHEAMPQIAEVVGKARAEILAPMVANPLEQDAAGRIARVLDGYENKFSGGMTPSDLHGMRKQVDKAIYGLRGNMDPFATPMKDALHDLRGIVSDEIDKAIEGAGSLRRRGRRRSGRTSHEPRGGVRRQGPTARRGTT